MNLSQYNISIYTMFTPTWVRYASSFFACILIRSISNCNTRLRTGDAYRLSNKNRKAVVMYLKAIEIDQEFEVSVFRVLK